MPSRETGMALRARRCSGSRPGAEIRCQLHQIRKVDPRTTALSNTNQNTSNLVRSVSDLLETVYELIEILLGELEIFNLPIERVVYSGIAGNEFKTNSK